MTPERKASIVRGLFTLSLLAAAVAVAILYPSKDKAEEKAEKDQLPQVTTATLEKAKNSGKPLDLIQHHIDGNPDSEKLAELLKLVQQNYQKDVAVHQIDGEKFEDLCKAEGVDKFPHVDIFHEGQKVYEFNGLQEQRVIEQKIDELLRGLVKRVGKDWRPPVAGMQPAGQRSVIEIQPADP